MKTLTVKTLALLIAILCLGSPIAFQGCNSSVVLAAPKGLTAIAAAMPTPQGLSYFSNMSWVPVTVASCTTPCQISYNVFRGTTAGGESATPTTGNTIGCTTNPCTFSDAAAPLGSTIYPATTAPAVFFYVVKAVEIVSPTLTITGPASNEFSVTFPAPPSAPTGATGAPGSQ